MKKKLPVDGILEKQLYETEEMAAKSYNHKIIYFIIWTL